MASLREQILARCQAALLNATPAGANVFRSREISINRAVSPSIVVMPDGESSTRKGQFADQHALLVKICIFVRGDPWDQLADPLAVAAHQVLMSDAPLAALAVDVRKVGTDFEAEEADRTAGTLTARYAITYLSSARDIAAAP